MPGLEKTERREPDDSRLNLLSSRLVPNFTVTGPYWPEPVDILSTDESLTDVIMVQSVGLESRKHYTTSLPLTAWNNLNVKKTQELLDE